MCGVVAVLGLPREQAEPAARRMLAALRHRGPDGEGVEVVAGPPGAPPVVLAHARLAIVDTSPAGAQPMAKAPRRDPAAPERWLTYNGEVYGWRALRDQLGPGRTRSDTEVVLDAWDEWGDGAAERLRGMFALVLADPGAGRVWLLRDRLGIKPLWTARPAGGGLLVASEVRALLAAGPELVPARLDPTALEGFLAQGCVYGRASLVAGVELVAPGTSLVVDWSGRTLSTRSYWQVPFAPAGAAGSKVERRRVVERLQAVLREAVKLHLEADVPVGLFLSGGVDSAAIAAIATEVQASGGPPGEVRSLCVAAEPGGGDDAALDESAGAEATARVLGTKHTTVRLGGVELAAGLTAGLDATDQPSMDGLNTFLVSRAAREAGLKVALSGLGGDEIFGGYPSFRDVPRAVRIRSLSKGLDRFERVAPLAAKIIGGRRGDKLAAAMQREPDLLELYLLRREVFLPLERRALHPHPGGGCDPVTGVSEEALGALRALARGLDPQNRISAFELGGYMRHLLLRDTDAFSMANGLEVRVPLLDHELVDLAAACPGAWRLRDPRPKPLLQDAVGPRLPLPVRRATKRGFQLPFNGWLRGPLRGLALEALDAPALWSRIGITPEGPGRLWARFEKGDPTVGPVQLLALVSLARWVRRHGVSL